jgi:hypothetical protein
VKRWLSERFADEDRLVISRIDLIRTANGGNRASRRLIAGATIDYSRRTSIALRELGYERGIVPRNATKVALAAGSIPRIDQFANAGNDVACVPVAAP